MKTKWQQIKNEILKSPKWLVSIDGNDIESFATGNDSNIIVLEASTVDSSDERFNVLITDILNQYNTINLIRYNSLKMLMFVQFPISFPIMMVEMNSINEMTNYITVDDISEITWGLSPREDNKSRIICVFNPIL